MPEAPEEVPVLQFEDVTIGFDEGPVLKDVSFAVGKGQTVIFLGAAGSGKSVLLKTAIGLLKAWSGKVLLFGQDITGLSEEQLFDVRSKVGMAFQESALFDSMSIEQNVAYPLLNQKAVKCETKDVRPQCERSARVRGTGADV